MEPICCTCGFCSNSFHSDGIQENRAPFPMGGSGTSDSSGTLNKIKNRAFRTLEVFKWVGE